ncbi:uncharacterized protein LOC128034969 isoform X1 [Gossypium raimondii]|uniref:uncharacterized protein LOC128034969 isoform X1 n=1 Tax=Gossypium raimondii TaxID=29730 RepID=UPI00227C8B99|nr:uncharacterized protein LOC128034969 isoform X1 [Gossypium raimondii]
MTLPTSSLFPLTTLLPLLAFAPLFSRKSAVKMVSTDGFTARCRFSCSYTDAEPQQDIYAKGDEYHKFRESAAFIAICIFVISINQIYTCIHTYIYEHHEYKLHCSI